MHQRNLFADVEARRQEAIDDLAIDPLLRTALDELTHQAARTFGVPMAAVTILARDRQLLEARVGIEAESTEREHAFCNWTIQSPDTVTLIEDASTDPRVASNPMVQGPMGLRFYAGAPLTLRGGQTIGALCVLDTRPQVPDPKKLQVLRALADDVVATLEARRFRRGT